MSYEYDQQESHRRHKPERSRRDRPVYEEEEIIETRNGPPRGGRTMDLARRPREDSDSIEEIQREFPPGEGAYVQRRTTVRDKYASAPRRTRSIDRGYEDEYYRVDARRSDPAVGGGRRRGGRDSDRRRNRRSRYESDSESSDFESPKPRERRKSLGEQALAALGLGGIAAAATGRGRDRSESRSRAGRSGRGTSRRRHRSSSYDSRSREREPDTQAKIQQAVKAALIAGATEAFRSRKEPGGWGGDKGKRVLTAAIGAGGIDGLVSGNDPDKKGGRHTIEAVIGGLAGNRLINGPRDNERSRSRGGGDRRKSGGFGLKDLAAGGIAAAGAKALLDRSRSKSRGRRDYSDSESSYDSSPPRKRSSSVGAFAKRGIDKGMAMVGLGGGDNNQSKHRDSRYSDRDGGYRDQQVRPRGGGAEEKSGTSSSGSESDLDISSSEEERRHKKMRGKEFLTAGLATVATIHAAHSVYSSYENRQKRRKEVLEGTMSPEEAKKKKSKATLQDAASVGIAALGIKGAISEWKEMKEKRDECHEFESKSEKRKERRLQRMKSGNGNYRNSEPNLNQAYQNGGYQNGYGGGPRYNDGNPYSSGALPPPPMGPPPSRYY